MVLFKFMQELIPMMKGIHAANQFPLESSNSSIDSGTFDVFDDPDDHFYDEPLLSSCDYTLDDNKYRKTSSSSSSSSDVITISTVNSSSAIDSLLIGTNYKPLKNLENSQHKQSSTSSPNQVINKPKLRPPKPPRHINPLTGKKLINPNQESSSKLPLTLPPKGVRSLSTSSSSSGVSSGSPSPSPLTPTCPPSPPPPLPPPCISRKPDRPPPPVPGHPPKPLRKKSEIVPIKGKEQPDGSLSVNQVTISQEPVSQASDSKGSKNQEIDVKPSTAPMAVLNRSRSSQGSFYETAFDSKALIHDNLHRDQMNHLSHNHSISHRQPLNLSTYHSQHHHHRSTEGNSSVSSFIPDFINSSRSSTASSTGSSSSTGHESSSSTPKHLDQLAKSLMPRRQGVKSTIHIPRSKSSDVTLNLSTVPCNSSSSSSSSPVNQVDQPSNSKPTTSPTSANQQQQSNEASAKRNQRAKLSSLSTFSSLLKSATSDALSSLDCEAGRVLTRTRSNLDSLRLSIHERNGRINNLTKEDIASCESLESNRNQASTSANRNSVCKVVSSNSLSSTTATTTTSNNNSLNNIMTVNNKNSNNSSMLNMNNNANSKVTVSDKIPVNRSFRRLNLKLDETRSSINLSSPKLQSPLTDTRPLDDYDTPWDSNQRLNKVFNKLINTPTSEKFTTDCFPSVNSAKLATPSTESNPISNDSPCNGDLKERKNSADYGQRIDKSDDQSSQQKSSNGSTHSSNSSCSDNETNYVKSCSLTSPNEPVKDVKPERPRKLSLPLNLKTGNCNTSANETNSCQSSTPRVNLNLDLCNSSIDSPSPSATSALKFGLGPRKKPLLTFTGQPLPVVSEDIDTSLILEKQGWYHGSITRLDAENLLRNMKEGSYLIRNCESTKQDYSLSLKSIKGFMHMKIVKQSDGKFVLGVFSKPFSSIPEMVKHYSINKLPIRGAEHMSLLYPVIDQLL
ncbi:uncharacterized protein DDB_G0287625 isoform X2 [Tetranychus urticae]|uniref:uncharacterized protein DDB_G0287625 isoform X2 n=1 Tax=Tetranychus urticae TaxID=32264 RepID=UPI00077B91D9|nr:uncharacterized protein DDB_G0287625 isoform X2 [Tetranychus urticae]